jgi:hypothetical protein
METYYHGSQGDFRTFPGICFTSDDGSAQSYGGILTTIEIDLDELSVKHIELSDDDVRECLDENEWPCDRQSQIDTLIKQGVDAITYRDADESGDTHNCLRLLSAKALTAAE